MGKLLAQVTPGATPVAAGCLGAGEDAACGLSDPDAEPDVVRQGLNVLATCCLFGRPCDEINRTANVRSTPDESLARSCSGARRPSATFNTHSRSLQDSGNLAPSRAQPTRAGDPDDPSSDDRSVTLAVSPIRPIAGSSGGPNELVAWDTTPPAGQPDLPPNCGRPERHRCPHQVPERSGSAGSLRLAGFAHDRETLDEASYQQRRRSEAVS
jgi:hypothetical protein